MKKMLLGAVSVCLLMGCTGNTKTEGSKQDALNGSVERVQTAQNTIEKTNDNCYISCVVGVYTGTLPAASSPGIKTELTLNDDQTFTLLSEFLEEKDGKFTEQGTFDITGGILTTTAKGGTISYFKVEQDQLRMLNQDKQEITGELAAFYVLKKAK